MNHDTPGPLYWHERGHVMRFSQGEARPLPLAEADKLLAFYRTEGPKADRASADYMARCFRDLTDAQIDAQLAANATNMALARSIGREDLADICRRSMGQIHAEIERRDAA